MRRIQIGAMVWATVREKRHRRPADPSDEVAVVVVVVVVVVSTGVECMSNDNIVVDGGHR